VDPHSQVTIFDSYSEEFLVTHSKEFLVTHSEEILITLSKEFLVTNSMEFLVTNSTEKNWRKCRQNLWKFLGIFSEKFFRTNSWELFPRVPQEYLEIFSAYS